MDEDLKKRIESTAAETRRHFNIVAQRLETKVKAVAEGVDLVHQRIDRIETTMKGEFNDVRSMIKSSHHALDCRVQALEDLPDHD